MKYEITLLTKKGPVKEIYTDDINSDNFQTIAEFEQDMVKKHGEFIMLSSNQID